MQNITSQNKMHNQILDRLERIEHSLANIANFLTHFASSNNKCGRPPPKGPKVPCNPGPPLPRAPPLPQPKKPWQPKRAKEQHAKYSGIQKTGCKSPKRGRPVSPCSTRSKKAWKKKQGGVKYVASLKEIDIKEIHTEKAADTVSRERVNVEAFLAQIPIPVRAAS